MKTKFYSHILSVLLLVLSACIGPRAYAQSPFNGFALGLPATIECEQFDTGGQNVGYYTPTPGNTGGKYRNEQISIYRSQDYGGTYGYCVATWPGEWLQYTITSSEAATYRIEVRARMSASATSVSSIHVNVNGVNATGPLTLWNYNTNWQTISATASVPSGTVALRLVIDSGDITYGSGMFDYITVYKVPPALSAGSSSAVTGLSTATDITTAKNNATVIQNSINALGTGGGTVTLPSGTYYICQPSPIETFPYTAGSDSAPLSASSPGTQTRNDYPGWVGLRFTTSTNNLSVTQLGRWVVSGNSQIHTVSLFDAFGNQLLYTNGTTVSVTVTNANQPTGQFVYSRLPSPFTLQANTQYSLMSSESSLAGADSWYDYTQNQNVLNSNNAVGVGSGWAVYQPGLGQLTDAANGSGKCYGPVSLLYNAVEAQVVHNYALWVNANNVTIKGDPTFGTTLTAFNRATTVLLIGVGAYNPTTPNGGKAVSNILLQNITFQGNPTVDWSGFYNPTGIVKWASAPNAIGSLTAIGGDSDLASSTNYTQGVVVQNCTFYNPSSSGITLWYDQDGLIQNNSWSYFNGMTSAQVANTLAVPGVYTQFQWVQDIAILNNTFNGNAKANPSMQATDSACDGFVWLAKGGKWIVEGNTINNYYLEGIQMNAGPYSVVGNSYSTPSTCVSACALSTAHDFCSAVN